MLSDEIKQSRYGNITASKASAIMTGWDAPEPSRDYSIGIHAWISKHERKPSVGELKEVLDEDVSMKLIEPAWKAYQYDKPSQGLITYAEELACDELFYPDPSLDFQTQSMINGNEREVDAVNLLIEATGLEFVNTGEDQIHITSNGVGATADGLVKDELDLIETGCEVKCRMAIHHARQLVVKDNASLIEHDFDRYCQIQVGCLVTEADHWYSVNYNPFGKEPELCFNYCVIQRDDAFLEVFKRRVELTYKYKAAFLNMLIDATGYQANTEAA